jgi:hypothetical protein
VPCKDGPQRPMEIVENLDAQARGFSWASSPRSRSCYSCYSDVSAATPCGVPTQPSEQRRQLNAWIRVTGQAAQEVG